MVISARIVYSYPCKPTNHMFGSGVSLSLPLPLTGEGGSELMFVWCEVELPHHVNDKLV